ncbi:MAG: glycosyltransferase family 2 protein [Prevotellaceae bacterium]|nr:glycosyltransferase family 2 protein [Prevotellaceae bacterium]
MPVKLSAILVSYNVKYYLAQAISSIYRAADGFELEVLVVDNASTDGTIDYLKLIFAQETDKTLHIIANTDNVGFGRANNQALHQATGDYILFVNPDTIIGETCLSQCLTFYRQHPDAGALGVRMLNPNGTFAPESRRGVPTPFTSFCKLVGLSRLFPKSKWLNRYYMQYLNDHEVCKIDIVSGAFMMMSRERALTAGGFDETFFMYGEDVDLSYRIMRTGCQNYYLPCPILHYKGESTNKGTPHYVNTFYKAMAIFFRKHYPHSRGLVIPVYVAIYLLAAKALLFQCLYKMRRSLHLFHEPATAYHFIMSQASLQHAKRLADKYHLAATYTTVPDNPPEPSLDAIPARDGKRHVAVYDTRSYTFSEILATFDAANRTDCTIGTFYPDQGLLITDKRTFLI